MSHAARFAFFALSVGWAAPADPALVVYLDGAVDEYATLAEMKSEFAAVTQSMGWSTEWRDISTRNGTGEAASSIVVRFRGSCNSTAEPRPVSTGEPLASVQEVGGRILPFVDVYCDALVSTVAPSFTFQPIYLRQTMLGRALGRVLAHEAHHIVLQTSAHAREGINEARLQRQDLTSRLSPPPARPSLIGGSDSGR